VQKLWRDSLQIEAGEAKASGIKSDFYPPIVKFALLLVISNYKISYFFIWLILLCRWQLQGTWLIWLQI
jgi:hypothetical protein